MNRHEDIYKERFLVWLMFAVPILCTGWLGLIIWTAVQLCLADSDIENYENYRTREEEECKKRMERNKTARVRYLEKENKEYNLKLPRELELERNRRNADLGGNWIVTKKGEWINIEQYDHIYYF